MSLSQEPISALQHIPDVIFGTSSLGNLYHEVPFDEKLEIVRACVQHSDGLAVFDTAGKYGAGLSLESIGKCLKHLNVHPSKVLISNKLGWFRVPLVGLEPTFEPGVWKGIKHDAVQKISYEGILECFHQGNSLLGDYSAQLVSVHDPDEYLEKAIDQADEEKRYLDILEAYRALLDLKKEGKVLAVGIGAKKWKIIQRISQDVKLDWVMIANSLTLHDHSPDLLAFISQLADKHIMVINSAVFHGGFLVGSDYYNYQLVDRETRQGSVLYEWRDKFWTICDRFSIKPAEACFAFGFGVEGIKSVALNTSKSEKVQENISMAKRSIPKEFWDAMRDEGLLN